MAWYTILFITVFTLFAVKLIMSWFAGDFEMDVDFDGIDDFDVSGAFSFKGLVHFLLGFSSYLFLRANMVEIDKLNGVAQFGMIDYMFATIVGVILMFALFYGYKLALKANNSSKNPSDLIDNSKGIIYINLGNGQYSVEAHTLAGTTNVTAFYTSDDLEPGTEVTLIKEGNNIYIK
jgi:hypothetical protein